MGARTVWVMLCLAGVATLCVIAVNPRAEFPLNDDWLYTRVVQQFLDTGRLAKPPLAAVSLVAQTLWGSAASKVFGFSHTTLRLSSVLLHLLAALATAAAVGRRAKTSHAAFAGLLILLSPLGLVSAFSFMPEPALEAALAVTLLAAVRWEERHTAARGIAVALAAASAYLVHPVAAVVPAWLLVRAWGRPRGVGSDTAVVGERSYVRLLPGLAALAGVVPFLAWYLHGTQGTMSGMWISRSSGIDLVLRLFSRGSSVVVYLGLLLLPLGVSLLSWRRTLFPTCFILWAWGQAWWLGAPAPLPLPSLENVLHPAGLGFIGVQGVPPALPSWFWMTLSVGSLGAAIGLVGRLLPPSALPVWTGLFLGIIPWIGGLVLGPSLLRAIVAGMGGSAFWLWAFWGALRARGSLALGIVWLAILAALPPFYDRYLVPLLPLFVVDLASRVERTRPWIWALLALMGILAVIGTHDYLAWNRCRWDQIAALEEQGVEPDSIDGGYEWAGWRHAWRGTPSDRPAAAHAPWWIRLWAPQIVPRYAVALGPVPAYCLEGIVPCPTVVPGWNVHILKGPASKGPQHGGGESP